jgi:hypothetical protein
VPHGHSSLKSKQAFSYATVAGGSLAETSVSFTND